MRQLRNEAFLKKEGRTAEMVVSGEDTVPKRRTKKQIKELILIKLGDKSVSANELYKSLGYSGNVSQTFRRCVEELIAEGKIYYASDKQQDAHNVLVKK